jgi:hypothetical protein
VAAWRSEAGWQQRGGGAAGALVVVVVVVVVCWAARPPRLRLQLLLTLPWRMHTPRPCGRCETNSHSSGSTWRRRGRRGLPCSWRSSRCLWPPRS